MSRYPRLPLMTTALLTLVSLPDVLHGHGRMEDPPGRNAAWRYGFDVPANYDDVGLDCGGLSVQKTNGGKCGICGDAYTSNRPHESGGKYATNTIVRQYVSGALIDVKILLSGNHQGFMELRLCPVADPNLEVTQECLNRNVLIIDGVGSRYPVKTGLDTIFFRARLPAGLSCSRCVLQWRYHAGNNWGRNAETGAACFGCGLQEEFYNCADISITAKPNTFLSAQAEKTNTNDPFSLALSPHFNIEESKPKQTIRCYPTNEALKPLIGIEHWCFQLCAIHCPPALCTCV